MNGQPELNEIRSFSRRGALHGLSSSRPLAAGPKGFRRPLSEPTFGVMTRACARVVNARAFSLRMNAQAIFALRSFRRVPLDRAEGAGA